jgi:predicted nucleic acid-binding protein
VRGPQQQIARVLKVCDIVPDDERTGRAVGLACAAAGTSDVVDAIVVVTAVRHRAPVVTSDLGDITRIAEAIGVRIQCFTI